MELCRPRYRGSPVIEPDALVLGAGGTLGEAWLRGVLNGLEAGADLDFRDCEYLLGTSAGSIVAATLAAGKRPEAGERAAREWAQRGAGRDPTEEPETARCRGASARRARAAATPFAPARAGDDRARRPRSPGPPCCAARRAPSARSATWAGTSRPLGARFDGRLRIVGRRPRERQARDVRRAGRAARDGRRGRARLLRGAVDVRAGARSAEREYVDGGVWSPTNLDAVPAGRGSRVLALVPTAGAALTPLRTATSPAVGYEGMPPCAARGATVTHDRARRRVPEGDRPEPDGRVAPRRGRRRGLRAGPPRNS